MRVASRFLLSVACAGVLLTPALAAAKPPTVPKLVRQVDRAWGKYLKSAGTAASARPGDVGTPFLHARAGLLAARVATLATSLATHHQGELATSWRGVSQQVQALSTSHQGAVHWSHDNWKFADHNQRLASVHLPLVNDLITSALDKTRQARTAVPAQTSFLDR
jgi:hypothetical protein